MDREQRRLRRLDQKMWRGERGGRGRGRPRLHAPEASNRESTDHPGRTCSYCGVNERSTPMMRAGPGGPTSLCNACGLKWAKQGIMGGPPNVSEEESTDDVTMYEGGVDSTMKDLQAQLHLSDARGLKWQKIAEERSEKSKELQMEIECLNLKIKEITEQKATRPGPSELKLRGEYQSLRDKCSGLMETLEQLGKYFASGTEMVTLALQDNKTHQQTSHHHQASKEMWNAGRNGHESIAEVNICVHDVNDGHQQASKRTGNSGRNGYESAAEVNAIIEDETDAHHHAQTQHFGRNGLGNVTLAEAAGGSHKVLHNNGVKSGTSRKNRCDSKADVTVDIGGQSSEEDGCHRHHSSDRPEQPTNYENLGPEESPGKDASETLFTATQRKSALRFVDQEFLMWLNSRIRRPTDKEMSYHKSKLLKLLDRPSAPGHDLFYWTGIPGSSILEKFNEETGMEKPASSALTNLLRGEFGIKGSKRANEMLWCLVWVDCTNFEQLPGYARQTSDSKRPRDSDPEDIIRCAKQRHP